LCAGFRGVTIVEMEPWVPSDDATLIMGVLMEMDARLEELGEHIVAIRRLLEDDEEEAEED
jgi:hypothetical protein